MAASSTFFAATSRWRHLLARNDIRCRPSGDQGQQRDRHLLFPSRHYCLLTLLLSSVQCTLFVFTSSKDAMNDTARNSVTNNKSKKINIHIQAENTNF